MSYRLEEATAQLGALRIRIAACSALALLLASLIVPMYFDDGESDSADLTLGGLAGQAADLGDGAIQTLAVVAVVSLILTMLLTLASIFEEDRRLAWGQGAAAGLLLVVWIVLMVAVDNSEGGGVFDGTGLHSTLRTALVPAGALVSLLALRVARQVRD